MLQMNALLKLRLCGYDSLSAYRDANKGLSFGSYCFRIPIHGEEVDVDFDFPGFAAHILNEDTLMLEAGGANEICNDNARLDDCFDDRYEHLGFKRDELTAEVLSSVVKIKDFFVECEAQIESFQLLAIDFEEDGVRFPVSDGVVKKYRPRCGDFVLTDEGRRKISFFIAECNAKRKEILDAKLDTADETHLPDEADILFDLNFGVGVDDEGDYYNSWGVTDHYDSDRPLGLSADVDFVVKFSREWI